MGLKLTIGTTLQPRTKNIFVCNAYGQRLYTTKSKRGNRNTWKEENFHQHSIKGFLQMLHFVGQT
jgi:hypothetical protein